MKALVILALIGLLANYVSGRAIIVQDEDMQDAAPSTDSYDECMMTCEDEKRECLDDAGDNMDERDACGDSYENCSGISSRDESDIPSYKRVAKRTCRDLMNKVQDTSKNNKVSFDFLMQQ